MDKKGLSIEHLYKTFQGKSVLKDCCLQVEAGEFCTLLAPSGEGKTTILRILAGLLPADQGKIFWKGQEISGLPPARRKMAMVFQHNALFPHMTVGENLAFGLQMQKKSREVQRERVQAMLAALQLDGFEDRMPATLSGGQQQRVALGRALIVEPDVLLCDEPLSALDENLRREMGELLRTLHDRTGVTTLYITHDQREAYRLSDTIALLQGGRILQHDRPQRIFDAPASIEAARFLGISNWVRGEELGKAGCICGCRPEELAVLPDGRIEAETVQAAYEGGYIRAQFRTADGSCLTAELPESCGIKAGVSCRLDSVKWRIFADGDRGDI